MDVEKLNNVYENNEARFSKLEDELGEIEIDSGCESLEEASN
ncbi:24624_t:CDS:2 [Entrophospora sp. SA101]|nr:14764_t:CDS:2 [Entrophospora sp. SA101]CAJ0757919.1 24624_t:CDS:2 [Entrophospora sp. SA101]